MSEISHNSPDSMRFSGAEEDQLPAGGEQQSWLNRLARFHERPFGKLTTGIVTMLVLAGALPRHETAPKETYITNSANVVAGPAGMVDLKIASGDQVVTLHLADWEAAGAIIPSESQAIITPDAVLEDIATTNNPFTDEIGLTPPEIENEAAFASWVEDQSQRQDLLEALEITPHSAMTPRQLVDLAASIVMANIDYELDRSVHVPYDLPMDENLMEGRKLQCEGYASATLAVFNELKKLHPIELKNTYMTTQSGIQEGHVWNMIVQIQSSQEAQVAFIDATADDPSYSETEPEVPLGFIELLEGLFDKGIINADAFRIIAQQYQEKYGLTQQQLDELADDELYLM